MHVGVDKSEHKFTFQDMKKMSARAANYFRSLGVKKGDRVMLILRRNWQYWPIVVGLEKLGAIFSTQYGNGDVDRIIYNHY